jgi:hypothetical protein
MLQLTRNFRDYVLYLRRRQLIRRDWQAHYTKMFALHPDYRRPVVRDVEGAHRDRWQPFWRRLSLDTLRVCAGISGRAEPRVVPEEVFTADIEHCLNRLDWAPFFAHKSFYSLFLPADVFPDVLMHRIGGDYFHSTGQPIDPADVGARIQDFEYPLVCKPSTDSSGGKNVCFPAGPEELRDRLAALDNCVVQRLIRQHSFLDQFNSYGLNTLRVYTYKSVTTGDIHVLNATLRMGRGGSLDNVTSGGIFCYVHPDGRLHHYAVDKYGGKLTSHPDTGVCFAGPLTIPEFAAMKLLAVRLAARLPLVRVAGWDVVLDRDGRWRCIEVNLAGNTIRFAQYAGQPFFGDFTDEVIDYCLSHPRRQRAVRKVY